MIKKIKGKYTVLSETMARSRRRSGRHPGRASGLGAGRSFGSYKTLAEAKRRLRQVEFFKRLSKHPELRRTLRKKSLAK